MTTASLFRLGGSAALLAAVLFGAGNITYFLSRQQPTTLGYWVGIIGNAFFVLALCAVFARQAQRGGVLGLIGFVLLVWSLLGDIGVQAVSLGVAAGVFTNAQLAQVPGYALVDTVHFWMFVVGQIALGISIYRARVLPQYAGALLVVLGLIQPLTGPLAFTRPIYAIGFFVAWSWLGWSLLMAKNAVSAQPVSAT